MASDIFRRRPALFAAGLLLAANLIVPLVWGDVYPFTSAPMFRDAPRQYCNYRVLAADGNELPVADWRLQRVYDGNPVGYGVGLRSPAVLEQQFGIVHSEAAVRQHVLRQLSESRHAGHDAVVVIQEIVGPVGGQQVGVVRENRWRVERP